MTRIIEAARRAVEEARAQLRAAVDAIDALPDTATEEQSAVAQSAFEEAEEELNRCRQNLARAERIERAREESEPLTPAPALEERVQVGREEPTYRPDTQSVSFFRDLVFAGQGDFRAQERLRRHDQEVLAAGVAPEQRDLTTTATAGGGFVPPLYLGDLYADVPRAGRPFANALGSRPLPPQGMTISIPRITTGPATAVQSDNQNFQETDLVETTLSVSVRTIGGVQDVSLQLLERSDPSIDAIIFQGLRDSYDTVLDTQLLSGTGQSGQHLGIRAVGSINTVTFTDATPTAANHVPRIYDAIQQIASGRFRAADMILMHPRRAAFLASNLSSTFPLFQLGSLTQASGTQDGGMVQSFSGLRVVLDPNIGTTYSTDQDEIYVVHSPDLILWEGEQRAEVFRDVLSLAGTVRLRLYGYSAFASGRQPESICAISGTGLAAPTFTG